MSKLFRAFRCEMRKDSGSRKLVGHAAVFNQETVIWDIFREMVVPGAFVETIKEDDIRALFNHDANYVLGRNVAKTLTLREDDTGLRVEIDPPDTQIIRDMVVSPIERGDIDQMSFAFEIRGSEDVEWQKGEKGMLDLRKIKRVKLYDVSPVTFPAYKGTDISAREEREAKQAYEAWAKAQEVPEPSPAPVVVVHVSADVRRSLLRRP